jgi:hypothetical protein
MGKSKNFGGVLRKTKERGQRKSSAPFLFVTLFFCRDHIVDHFVAHFIIFQILNRLSA